MKTDVYRDPLSGYSTTFATRVDDRELRAAFDPNVVLVEVRRRLVEEIVSRIIVKLEPAIEESIRVIGENLVLGPETPDGDRQ